MKNYGGESPSQMSSNFNVDQGTVQKLIPQLAPLIVSGLKRQKDTQGGDERVNHILNKYGDSSVLDNIKDLISSKANAPSVDASTIMKMIPALSPIIFGALSKKRDTSGAGLSGIGSMLDADGDGSIIDDVAGFLLKGSGTTQTKSKGVLGSVLGGLLRRK